jgi:WD40 repeat protein
MPVLLTCSQGHQWETSADGPPHTSDAKAHCPVCGATVALQPRGVPGSGGIEAVPLPPGPAPAAAAAPGAAGEAEPVTLPPAGQAPAWAAADQGAVPGYEILGELGRGGMGVVYKARQTRLGRLVALKMILAGAHAGEADLARFRTEAEAIARLQHPHIVQIHEVGEQDGLPFFSLEFCPGGSLERKLNGTPLPPRVAAALVEKLARAMEAAHQKGVVHRDLKPANVLLAEDGTPKITDFGLARKLGEAGQTATGAVMGTPSYMAPEQASGQSNEIGPAADVYALGAILYECLTGRPPFRAATSLDTLLQVVSDEPVPPRRLQPTTPADLETVCLKCLQKERHRRYASAAALAEDLRRFQAGEVIAARPVGIAERGWKWVRRNPVVAGSVAAVAAALLLGAGVATLFAVKAEFRARGEKQAREAADEARHHAEWLAYAGQIALAQREWQDNNVAHARDLLAACQEDLRGWEHAYLRHVCESHQRNFLGHTREVLSVCWSPDGKRLASADGDRDGGEVKVWDAATGRQLLSLKGHTGLVQSVCWSPDGKRLASASYDQTVKVWDAASGQEVRTLGGGHTGGVLSVCWSPDGRRLATASGGPDWGEVKLWDAQTGQEARTLQGHTSDVTSVCWSPDGRRLATASTDKTVKLWGAADGREVLTLKGHTAPVECVCWSPDGQHLASAAGGFAHPNELKVWDASGGQDALTLKGHAGWVFGVCWSPDGKRLASAGGGSAGGDFGYPGEVKVWDAEKGLEVHTLKGHTLEVKSVCWSPDGRRLASASHDGTVKVWDVEKGLAALTLKGHTGTVESVCWSPDGRRLASASKGYEIKDGKAVNFRGEVKVWDAATGQEVLSLKGHTGLVQSVCWSPDGRRLASAGGELDAQGKPLPGEMKVWDAASGQEVLSLKGHTGLVQSVCWSPDGRRLASAGGDPTGKRWEVRVWDANAGDQVLTLKGHTSWVNSVCWSPDGKRLASAGWDTTVKLWDTSSGQEALTLKVRGAGVNSVRWSPDGMRLAGACNDRTVKVWDARPVQRDGGADGPRPR